MRIGELARRAGTTAKTLRFYEQVGLLPQPVRTGSGYRDYDEGALDRLRFVRAAQSAGLTLADIRNVMAARDLNGPPCHHVTALLDRHADELDDRIATLVATRAEVHRLRARAGALDPGACTAASVCHLIGPRDEAADGVGSQALPVRPTCPDSGLGDRPAPLPDGKAARTGLTDGAARGQRCLGQSNATTSHHLRLVDPSGRGAETGSQTGSHSPRSTADSGGRPWRRQPCDLHSWTPADAGERRPLP